MNPIRSFVVVSQTSGNRFCSFFSSWSKSQISLISLCFIVCFTCYACFFVSPCFGQGRQLPAYSYFMQAGFIEEGNFKDALKAYNSELKGAMKTVSSRWIDSICCYAMLGECFYHQGLYPAAIENYNAALILFNQYSNWTLDVKFPQGISPQTNRQVDIPWGFGSRQRVIGRFPDTFNIQRGSVNQYDTLKNGGMVVQAHLIPVNVAEIWRCTALALYRRYELLGPMCKDDPLTDECVSRLSSGVVPPNHWTQCWADVARGMAYLCAENYQSAIPLLTRGALCAGQFDHPLSSLAFLALGRQALLAGNYPKAVQFFHEATVDSVFFWNMTVFEEAFRGMTIAHLATNPKTPLPALAPALQWSQKKKAGRRVQASLALNMADCLLYFYKNAEAGKLIQDVVQKSARRDMLAGEIGGRLNYLSAQMYYQSGQIPQGNQELVSALEYYAHGSKHLYRLGILDDLFKSGRMTTRSAITPRKAMDYYNLFLEEPTAQDWSVDSMDAFVRIALPRPESYENWFLIALDRKEAERAIEIADKGRKSRFYSRLPMGGRLLNLRLALETPKEGLSDLVKMQRDNILLELPGYEDLQGKSAEIKNQIRQLPAVPEDQEQVKELAGLYEQWRNLSAKQDSALYAAAMRRLPLESLFPPNKTFSDIQKELPEGEAALIFFRARDYMHAFLINKTQYTDWNIANFRKGRSKAKSIESLNEQLHKELGLFDPNKTFDLAAFKEAAWRDTAQELLTEILKDSKADFSQKFPALVIVPDDCLWYVPFEALQVQTGTKRRPLIWQFKIRYAPTASLAVPRSIPMLGSSVKWDYVQGQIASKESPETVLQICQSILGNRCASSGISKTTIPLSSNLFLARTDRLLVYCDLDSEYNNVPGTHLLGLDAKKPSGTLSECMTSPLGMPQALLLPGFHTPEECSFKQTSTLPGMDLFFTSCAIMSEGTQTLVLSRWRTGGYSNELTLKSFVQAFPDSDAQTAWQRAIITTAGSEMKPEAEPRIRLSGSGSDEAAASADNPGTENASSAERMSHPFFWAAYMLLDCGAAPSETEDQPNGGNIINFRKPQ